MKRKRKSRVRTETTGNAVVKIYTRVKHVNDEDYRVYEVCDYTAGERRLRSFSDLTKAKKAAKKIADLLASGETEAAKMKGPETASYGRAVELIRETGVPLEVVAAHFAQAFKILGSDRIVEAARCLKKNDTHVLPQRTVKEVVDELLTAREARGASIRYLGDLRSRLNNFAEAFSMPISSVTTADVQAWFDKKTCAPQTLKNFKTVTNTLFEFAETRGYVQKGNNPVASTEDVKVGGGGAVQIYSPAEVIKLLESASESFRPCIAISAFAGLRSAEVERIDWKDIDLKGGFITVSADKAKTASRRVVPISANLKAWLSPCAKKAGPVWNGEHDEYYDSQQETAKAAGIVWKPNGLRHSYASYRLAKVKSAAQVALEMGNSASIVFRHYRELVTPKQAAAWFNVRPGAPANVVDMREEKTA